MCITETAGVRSVTLRRCRAQECMTYRVKHQGGCNAHKLLQGTTNYYLILPVKIPPKAHHFSKDAVPQYKSPSAQNSQYRPHSPSTELTSVLISPLNLQDAAAGQSEEKSSPCLSCVTGAEKEPSLGSELLLIGHQK